MPLDPTETARPIHRRGRVMTNRDQTMLSPHKPRVRYVVRDHATYLAPIGGRWAKWVVFDMLTRRQVASYDTRAEARSLATVRNAQDRLKRSLANAVQLELVDS